MESLFPSKILLFLSKHSHKTTASGAILHTIATLNFEIIHTPSISCFNMTSHLDEGFSCKSNGLALLPSKMDSPTSLPLVGLVESPPDHPVLSLMHLLPHHQLQLLCTATPLDRNCKLQSCLHEPYSSCT